MGSSKIEIQIGYDDLVRLIGGGDPASIDIRNGIVQTFAEKHLRSLINNATFKEMCDKYAEIALKEAREDVAKAFLTSERWTNAKVLTSGVKSQIVEQVKTAFRSAFSEAVTEQIRESMKEYDAQIATSLKTFEERMQRRFEEFEEQLKEIVNEIEEESIRMTVRERVREKVNGALSLLSEGGQ